MPSNTRNIQDMYRYSGGKCPLIQEIYKICIGTVAVKQRLQKIEGLLGNYLVIELKSL